MKQRIIRLCYRKVMDAGTPGAWEHHVVEDSYKEFLMQSQLYTRDNQYTTFAQLLHHTKGAEQLHFLVSAAITGYVTQLKGIVPDITNALGKTFLPFSNYRFEIINSDIRDKARHQVAVNFYTDELIWLDSIGDQLLLSLHKSHKEGEWLTEMVLLRPFVSIYSLNTST